LDDLLSALMLEVDIDVRRLTTLLRTKRSKSSPDRTGSIEVIPRT
jgi:hypothetical protein